MKNKSSTYWLVSALSLATAALWGVVTQLSEMVSTSTICGIALIVFGVISVIAAFGYGLKSAGSGWILAEGIFSFCIGISYIFPAVYPYFFVVDMSLVMGLWLMYMGISQLLRMGRKGGSFANVTITIAAVLAILGGIAIYVRPVADILQYGGFVQVYSTTFQFLIAALLVAARLLSKKSR